MRSSLWSIVLLVTAGVLLIDCQSGTKPVPAATRQDTLAVTTESSAVTQVRDSIPEIEETTQIEVKPRPTAKAEPRKDTVRSAVSAPKPDKTRPAKTESVVPAPAPTALPRLWDFGSDNCLPCKMMMPILEELSREYAGNVEIRIINVYKEGALASQYRVQMIPTQVFIDPTGKEIYRHVGYLSRDSILSKLAQFGWKQ